MPRSSELRKKGEKPSGFSPFFVVCKTVSIADLSVRGDDKQPGVLQGIARVLSMHQTGFLGLGNRFSDNGIAPQFFPVGSAAQAQSLVEFALHIADHRNTVKAVLERADVGGG